MLNKDSHRTGTSDTPICDCGMEEEIITHLLHHCVNYTLCENSRNAIPLFMLRTVKLF